jgi:hypothetical protein
MAYPTKPSIQTSYTAVEQALGDGSLPGQELDNDFANLKTAVDALNDFVRGVTRSDGRLGNGTVTRDALAVDILLGLEPPSPWQTGRVYRSPNTVFEDNKFYLAAIEHTSGVFADDVAAGRWIVLADFTTANAVVESRSITGAGLATGGGDLSADRTINVPVATQGEAEAGSINDKAMTPLRVAQAIAALQRAVATQGEAETGTDNAKAMTALRTREALRFFGVGEGTATRLLANLDADVPSGFYRTDATTTGAFPPGVAATTGYVSVYRDASNRIMQVFATANGANTELHMRKFDAGWAAWNTYTPAAQLTQAQAEDPASTVFGTVSGQRLEQQTDAAFNVSGSAPKFACRAWVNFNGTITSGNIRASGNVSSVTRNGTGLFTITFTTAMQDANYSIVASGGRSGDFEAVCSVRPDTRYNTTGVALKCNDASAVALQNPTHFLVAVFR